jgi:hypothetical protein
MGNISAKTREKLASAILADFKDNITGNKIERVVNENPENKFYVGKLISINDDDTNQSFNSKTFIESMGMDFYIKAEKAKGAVIRLFPIGDFYYRAYPTLEEQRSVFLNLINKSSEVTTYAEFDEILDEHKKDSSKFNKFTHKLIPVYKKIQLHESDVFFDLKMSDILNEATGYGFADHTHPINGQLDIYLQSLQDNIINDEEHYAFEVKQESTINNLISEEAWKNYIINNQKKQSRIIQKWKIYFDISIKKLGDKYLVAATIINDSIVQESSKNETIKRKQTKDPITLQTMFNSGIKIKLINADFDLVELDYFKDDYKYNRRQEAIGTNCSVKFIEEENAIITEHLPTYNQYRLVTNDELAVKFQELIDNPLTVLKNINVKMHAELKEWQKYRDSKMALNELTTDGKRSIDKEILDFGSEITRFKSGIDMLENYPELIKAFMLMNKTFCRASTKYKTWRLFQIVFIVSLIPDIAACDPELLTQEEKSKTSLNQMDLLYFPTGGGKTEAFLGALVFNLFFDRYRGKNCGVTAILRYPLRLLSVQQVQRVANILAQAELLRRIDNDIKNSNEFSLGYYVGDANTPNRVNMQQALQIKEQPQENKDKQRILDVCPFCGEQSVHIDMDLDTYRLVHYCDNQECKSGKMLPIFIVDSEIYRYLPSAIISTVDKLAAIGYNANFRNIINGTSFKCPKHGYTSKKKCIESSCDINVSDFEEIKMYDSSPSLFIQDELHLIRESLGTYASHYESLIDYYIKELSDSKRAVKVIGATATISSYEMQVAHLYKKDARRFPVASPYIDKNFYAHIDYKDLQRQIMGYAPYGKAIINSVVYSLKYMRQIVYKYYLEPEKILAIEDIGIVSIEDAREALKDFWIFLEYNNVKIDSNNVSNALEDPVNTELKEEGVIPFNTRKMTGDESFQDVREILANIENTDDVYDGINLIAATSMISHGVDADRFNVMFFYGIPGNTAEYIQAYSRAGRRHSSIVIDIMRPTRETDQSYLKNFMKFHEFKDIMVEAVPINRWATKAIESTLPGILAGLLINYYDVELQYTIGSLHNMKNLQKAIATNSIDNETVKNHLYKAYGCSDGGVYIDLGNQYKVKIDKFIDEIFLKILDRNWTWQDYIINGFEILGYKIMLSLRDTDKQLIIELE